MKHTYSQGDGADIYLSTHSEDAGHWVRVYSVETGLFNDLQSAVKRCSVQILCRCWVFLPVADASNGCTHWRVTGGGVLEVIVLIAGAWRLD